MSDVNKGRASIDPAAGRVGVAHYVPILGWIRSYDRKWLVADAVAGLSVWALLVPQSLAYATIVGVPVQYGLYTAFAALLVYPLFGTSKQLVVGPSATVGAVSAAVVTPLIGAAALGTDEAATYAAALALAVALVYLALGVLRMGWISTFLSRAVMSGFILGFAIGIIINQAPKLLGVPGIDGSYIQQLWGLLKALPDTSDVTLVVGAISLGLLLVMRYFAPKLPRALVVVVLSIVAVSASILQMRALPSPATSRPGSSRSAFRTSAGATRGSFSSALWPSSSSATPRRSRPREPWPVSATTRSTRTRS